MKSEREKERLNQIESDSNFELRLNYFLRTQTNSSGMNYL